MKFGLCISGQHLPGDSLAERFEEHIEQVEAAREGGFDSVWASHHYLADPFQMLQPLPVLARLAANAGNMTIGTAILLIPLLNPVDIAEQIATLDTICAGRFIFGVGLGYREIEDEVFGVVSGQRVPRFTETLELIKRLWTEESVDFRGNHFNFQGLKLVTKPVQKPHPPIWMAASSDKAIQRAAAMGDTWLISPHVSLSTLRSQVALFHQSRTLVGLPAADELPLMRELLISEDRTTALQEARPYLEQKYKTYVKWGQDKAMPTGEGFEMPFDDLVRDRFIVGTPADCVQQIARYRQQLGVTHMIFRLQWPGMEQAKVLRSIKLLSREVIPHFKA
jgi:alkanesulfonate monooxygenase SsuD/methylene tetrahydromethanopterin reductase-like flavin-dependent oxidoreductase (luciferase family)